MKRPGLMWGGIIVGVAVISFVGGMQVQRIRARTVAATPSTNSRFGGGGGAGGGFNSANRPVFGQVSSITSSSMVVASARGGTSVTVSLTGNPTVTDGSGNTSSVSAITTGSTVVVQGTHNSDGSVTATTIRLNPTFGGGGGSGGTGSGSTGNGT